MGIGARVNGISGEDKAWLEDVKAEKR